MLVSTAVSVFFKIENSFYLQYIQIELSDFLVCISPHSSINEALITVYYLLTCVKKFIAFVFLGKQSCFLMTGVIILLSWEIKMLFSCNNERGKLFTGAPWLIWWNSTVIQRSQHNWLEILLTGCRILLPAHSLSEHENCKCSITT